MFSPSLTLESPTIASESLIRAASSDICPQDDDSGEALRVSLGMKWVVVTGKDGNPRPQVRWRSN
jgi:hypothetical protein